jgi:hypothetical protein
MLRRFAPIATLLALLAGYQLSLLGAGTYSFQDEVRYKSAVNALMDFVQGDLHGGVFEIARMGSRPGETLVKMIPAALQFLPHVFGITPANPRSLLIPTVGNVVMSVAIVFLLYRIALLTFEADTMIALVVAIVYSLLVNTSVYVRHLFPYDWSLVLLMYALWTVLSGSATLRHAIVTGALTAFAVTVYPGYYPMAGVVGVVLVGRTVGATAGARAAGAFALGGLVVLAPVELFSRLGGFSLVLGARELTTTITLGSFEEGWMFLPRYLRDVEGGAGFLLGAGFVVYAARAAVTIWRERRLRLIDWLVLPAVTAWMWQATGASQLHWMVLYGRLIHPWFLFLALALGDAILVMRRGTARTAVCAAVVLTALISWAPSAAAYRRLAYPADVAYQIGADTTRIARRNMPCELEPWGILYDYASPPPLNRATGAPYSSASNYYLVNFCFGKPRSGAFDRTAAPADAHLIYEAPHFLTFPAYGFEGYRPEERGDLITRRYTVRAFRTPDASTAGDR